MKLRRAYKLHSRIILLVAKICACSIKIDHDFLQRKAANLCDSNSEHSYISKYTHPKTP